LTRRRNQVFNLPRRFIRLQIRMANHRRPLGKASRSMHQDQQFG
jgi:hypothetical protein